MSVPSTLRMRVLGGFALSTDATPAIDVQIASHRARALLAYLALQPELTESRERLATLLWGDREDKQARHSLRQCLLMLRKALEPTGVDVLQVGGDTVALDAGRIIVDARELPPLAHSAAPDGLEQAIALYQGDLLDGLRVASEAFEEWLASERTRLRSLGVLALEKAAASLDARGAGPAAIAAAERMVALDPLSESAQRRLLALLWRHGGRDAALVRADALVEMLQRELGAAPEPETQKLIAAIRSDRASAAMAAPEARPVDVAPSEKPAPAAAPILPTPEPRVASPEHQALRPVHARRIAVVAAAAALSAILVLAGRPWSAAPTREPQPAATPSWAPPGMLANLTPDRRPLAANGISALVVLPFTAVPNADGGGADRRLADLVSDDLVSDLSRVPGVRVIARQTARLYAGRPVDVAAVGAELGVRYVIEGSVQLQARTMRIEASLADVTTRLTVWSQRFERDFDERFSAHDEIIRAVARALQLGVIAAEDQRRPPATRDPETDALLARGWSAMVSLPSQGTGAAADRYFAAVLARDADNASALMGLGGYHAGLVAMFLVPDPDEHLARAEPLLQRATALQPSSAMSYYYLGLVQKARGQYQEALRTFTRVVELNPSFPLGYAQIGHLVSRLGRPGEAMEYIRYAVRLNPRDPNMGLIGMMAGEIELELHHDEAALDWLRRSVTLAPINPFIHAALGATLALTGDPRAARSEVEETRRLAPWLTLDRMVARLVTTSAPGHEPERLIAGLRLVFNTTP